jgi:hypothetical protein
MKLTCFESQQWLGQGYGSKMKTVNGKREVNCLNGFDNYPFLAMEDEFI